MGAARYGENPARSLRGVAGVVEGSLANIEGCDCYRIDGVDQMEPFLVSVVSSSDLWMFASSRGPLTAGRTDADRAFLPYETDDRIHRAVHITGPSIIRRRLVTTPGMRTPRAEASARRTRGVDGRTRTARQGSLAGSCIRRRWSPWTR